jgi:hypothetical protein
VGLEVLVDLAALVPSWPLASLVVVEDWVPLILGFLFEGATQVSFRLFLLSLYVCVATAGDLRFRLALNSSF